MDVLKIQWLTEGNSWVAQEGNWGLQGVSRRYPHYSCHKFWPKFWWFSHQNLHLWQRQGRGLQVNSMLVGKASSTQKRSYVGSPLSYLIWLFAWLLAIHWGICTLQTPFSLDYITDVFHRNSTALLFLTNFMHIQSHCDTRCLSGPLYPKLSTCFEGAQLTQLVQLVTAGRLFPCHKGWVDP